MLLAPEPPVMKRCWWTGSTSIPKYVENGNATEVVVVADAAGPADNATAATLPAAAIALAAAAASAR
jgi:hypothetical protein